MKQEQFIQRYQQQWMQFEKQLEILKTGRNTSELGDFPRQYRHLCHYLAIAKSRSYSSQLINHLNDLVLQGHQHLYRQKSQLTAICIDYLFRGFPRIVRQEWRTVTLAVLLFFGPLLLVSAMIAYDEELVYYILSPEHIHQMESMYDPERHTAFGKTRESDSDFQMFGFYIQNNIGIAFKTFAGGILFGLGSVFFLLFNGYFIGAVTGLMINFGFYETFFPFVIGHGAFELTAIALAGAAGLKIGGSLVAPGRLRRKDALRAAAQTGVKIIYGTTLMLLGAAFVEAFWSSSITVDNSLKYTVGGLLWLLVLLYFLLGGRGGTRKSND